MTPKRKLDKPQTFNVWTWVGVGRLLRHNGQAVIFRRRPAPPLEIAMVQATLTLTSGKPRRKNSGGPARSKGTNPIAKNERG